MTTGVAEVASPLTRGPRAWVHAARPPTLPAAIVPVLVGTALASGHGVRIATFVATLAAALLIQIGTNFANDYSDFKKGADTAARLGPTRITAAGIVTPQEVRRAAALAFGAAGLIGLYLVYAGGWPIALIGLASIAAGAGYTGGALAFGYYGLGDLVCFVFFGVIAVAGTYYLQAGTFAWNAILASVPVACLVTAIRLVNNVRDIETDREARKMTLAVRLGRSGTGRVHRAACGLCLGSAPRGNGSVSVVDLLAAARDHPAVHSADPGRFQSNRWPVA